MLEIILLPSRSCRIQADIDCTEPPGSPLQSWSTACIPAFY